MLEEEVERSKEKEKGPMATSSDKNLTEDPCGEFGPTQKWAVVWFLSILVIGSIAVWQFSKIDRRMYDSNAEFFDYGAYRENRLSQASLRGDSVDPRSHGDSVSVMQRGKGE